MDYDGEIILLKEVVLVNIKTAAAATEKWGSLLPVLT
jgi:hypothetical protein